MYSPNKVCRIQDTVTFRFIPITGLRIPLLGVLPWVWLLNLIVKATKPVNFDWGLHNNPTFCDSMFSFVSKLGHLAILPFWSGEVQMCLVNLNPSVFPSHPFCQGSQLSVLHVQLYCFCFRPSNFLIRITTTSKLRKLARKRSWQNLCLCG